jgi:hypothetical protein
MAIPRAAPRATPIPVPILIPTPKLFERWSSLLLFLVISSVSDLLLGISFGRPMLSFRLVSLLDGLAQQKLYLAVDAAQFLLRPTTQLVVEPLTQAQRKGFPVGHSIVLSGPARITTGRACPC